MSTFLNISTDTTLGGNSPSDLAVSSQKAIKTYVDAHSGGGGSTYTAGTGIDITNDVISVDGVQTSEVTLATVATTGAYSDLTGTPTVDQTYSASSTNAQSGVAVATALNSKQDTLVSGTNIKTVNNTSLLGSGNISVGVSMSYDSSTETLTFA